MIRRNIEQKIYDFISAKIAGNGSAQLAIKNKDARALLGYVLDSLVGIREVGGNNQGPLVELLQETIGGHGGEAWCMSTIQTGLAFVEKATGVISPLFASEHCLTVWAETPKEFRVKSFPAGNAVIIWQHGKTQNGHTGLYKETHDQGATMFTVEGNTESGLDAKGLVEREGGGVYRNKRSMKANGEMHVVGFLIPFPHVS
jgi:hypothetical protein